MLKMLCVDIKWYSFKPNCTGIYSGLWLGAMDVTNEETFTWESSGNPLTFNNWSSGQPDATYEDCIHMWCALENGEWNNIPCDYKEFSQSTICEVIFPCY